MASVKCKMTVYPFGHCKLALSLSSPLKKTGLKRSQSETHLCIRL